MKNGQLLPVALTLALIGLFWAAEARCCTSIMVGRKASADGSVMTSHTCDSHDNGSESRHRSRHKNISPANRS